MTIPINKKQIAYNKSNRTKAIQYIVIHDTGNTGRGANAAAHFQYFNGGNRQSSADFFVDDTQVLQVNDYRHFYTWHCGDGRGRYGITNNNSVGIEICINSDGDYEAAWKKTVDLTRWLMMELSIPAARVVRHYDASRKNCPGSMSANSWALWQKFKAAITAQSKEELTMTQYEELTKKIDQLAGKIPAPPMIYDYIDGNMPEWARPTIKKLAEAGYLRGGADGALGLTDEMLRILVILDRSGAFEN